MKRPRVTVLWMMILVAIVGAGIGLRGIYLRAWQFQELAVEHASKERRLGRFSAILDEFIERDEKGDREWRKGGETEDAIRGFIRRSHKDLSDHSLRAIQRIRRQKIAETRRLRIKYERAARRPWLPVEPDPPEPE